MSRSKRKEKWNNLPGRFAKRKPHLLLHSQLKEEDLGGRIQAKGKRKKAKGNWRGGETSKYQCSSVRKKRIRSECRKKGIKRE